MNFQLEHFYLPLILLYTHILIEGRCTPLTQFLVLVLRLFVQIEPVYCWGSGWVGLGVAVLSWSRDFVAMYMVLVV